MGKVLLTIQIMPKSAEVDLTRLAADIKKLKDLGEVKELKEEPIAFGLKALKLLTLVDDVGGVAEAIEQKLRSLKDVEDARVTDLTLV